MKSGVYHIVNTVNGKRYVGSAVDFQHRKATHLRTLRAGKHHSIKLQRAWDKHGEIAFEFILVEPMADLTLLIPTEQKHIDHYDVVSAGYNCAPKAGSTLGYKATKEHREKISKALKGKKKSPEHVAKVAAGNTGNKRTPEQAEHLRKIALGNKNCVGRKISTETRNKMAESHRGVALSEAHRKGISEAAKKGWIKRRENNLKDTCNTL